jgi:hypothetical protein
MHAYFFHLVKLALDSSPKIFFFTTQVLGWNHNSEEKIQRVGVLRDVVIYPCINNEFWYGVFEYLEVSNASFNLSR